MSERVAQYSHLYSWLFWPTVQLRECRGPLHPVVPPLIEAFVNSTLIPSRQAAQNTNEPLTQQVRGRG